MKKSRRKFSAKFKATVAIEALEEHKTLTEPFVIHPNQISKWKREFLENASLAFDGSSSAGDDSEKVDVKVLYSQIGQLWKFR